MTPHRPILISAAQYQEELATGTLRVRDTIEAAHRLGADGIELRPEYWTDKERELPAARDLIEQLGLLVTYATMATLFNADPDDAGVLRQDIDDARSLGSPQLRVFQGPAPSDDDAAGWQAGGEVVEYAAAQGIVLALENYARVPGCFVHEIERVLRHLPAPTLGTNIDIGNYARNGEDVPAAVRTLGGRAVSAHLKDQFADPADTRATYLGGGTLPLREILAELDNLPQRIIYCFEFQGGGEPDRRVEQSLAYLRGR